MQHKQQEALHMWRVKFPESLWVGVGRNNFRDMCWGLMQVTEWVGCQSCRLKKKEKVNALLCAVLNLNPFPVF